MRRLRVTVCLVFVAACAVFGLYIVKSRMVEDHEPPVIKVDSDEITVSVEAEDEELLKGVTAEDNKDGNITKSVRISSMSHFIEKGKRTVTYIVFDKANQAGTAQRMLVYSDYTSPRIYLTKPLRYFSNQISSANLLENVTAEDCLDGDLTSQVRTTLNDELFMGDPGDYPITLQVSNSAGDVCSLPVNVTIVDNSDRTESNKIYPMLSEYIVYTKVDKGIDPNQYLVGVIRGNAEYTFESDKDMIGIDKESIAVKSNVDYSKAGVYTVDFSYTDEEDMQAVTKLYVVVEE